MRGHSEGCSGGMKKQKFLSWHSVNEESLHSLWPGQVRLGRGLQPPRSPTLSRGDGAPERFAGRTHPRHTLQPLQASPARTRAWTHSMPTPLHTHMCLQPTRACALHTGAHPAHACAHWRALLTHTAITTALVTNPKQSTIWKKINSIPARPCIIFIFVSVLPIFNP